jgi:hypothetical protein
MPDQGELDDREHAVRRFARDLELDSEAGIE